MCKQRIKLSRDLTHTRMTFTVKLSFNGLPQGLAFSLLKQKLWNKIQHPFTSLFKKKKEGILKEEGR